MLFESIAVLNNNKIIWGVTMILLNMGSKYILADLGKIHEKVLTNELFKKLVLFSMFFVATRDLIVAFLLSVIYILIVDGIFHEKRNFTIVKELPKKHVTDMEYNHAKTIIKQYENNNIAESVEQSKKKEDEIYDNYLNNISLIRYI